MMHYWNDGYDNWWWMIPMTVGMLAVVVAVIWALLQASRTHQPASSPPVSPEEVLAQRLAAGEIDTADYRERLDVLRQRVTQSG